MRIESSEKYHCYKCGKKLIKAKTGMFFSCYNVDKQKTSKLLEVFILFLYERIYLSCE